MLVHFHLTDLQSAVIYNSAFITGTLLAMWIQLKEGRLRSYPVGSWLTVIAIVNGLMVLGSRLGGFSLSDYSGIISGENIPLHAHKTIMGGLLLLLPGYFLLKKWWKLPAAAFDILLLSFPLVGSFARIGCLLAGCCFGQLTSGGWGICYAAGTPAYAYQLNQGIIQPGIDSALAVHPVQLYFVFSNLLIFILLYKLKNSFKKPGSLGLLGLALLLLFRFSHEFFREASSNPGQFGHIFLGLKVVQWVCLGIGLCCLGVVINRERKPIKSKVSCIPFSGASLLNESSILLFTILSAWTMRHYLSSVEISILLVSFVPAILFVLKRLFALGWMRGRVLAPYAMVAFTLVAMADLYADSILPSPPSVKPATEGKNYHYWTDIGLGGTIGNWGLISRDCNNNIIGVDNIRNNSVGAEVNYHIANEKVEYVLGGRFIQGSTINEDAFPQDELKYTGFGGLARIEANTVGFGIGLMYFPTIVLNPETGNTLEGSYNINHGLHPIVSLRLGKRKSYFIDFRYYDNYMFSYFPQPIFEFGVVNWGFKDPSGNTNLKLGFASIQGETAYMATVKFPIKNSGICVSGGFYFQKGVLFSGGLHYTLPEYNRSR